MLVGLLLKGASTVLIPPTVCSAVCSTSSNPMGLANCALSCMLGARFAPTAASAALSASSVTSLTLPARVHPAAT